MEIQAVQLTQFSNRCLTKAGVPEEEAAIITTTMLEADARGIHSHGFMRLPNYIQRIRKGLVRSEAKIVVEQESAVTAVLDGCFSAGQVAAAKTMELAIDKALKHGLGAVTVKNSSHFGIASYYAQMASDQNLIGIVMSNTTPLMTPIGGAEKILGNNPFSIAAPTGGKYPLVLDMALSNVALGKILHAKTKGESIPEGWGLDQHGVSTTDPEAVLKGGFILPVGGPKGFGLAFMIELLTGVLSGGQFSKMIPSMYDLSQKQSISHFMLAIDVASFMPVELFKQQVGVLSSYVKNAVKATGITEIYLPGEIEFAAREKRLLSTIPVNENVATELKQLAEELDVPYID